MQSQEPPKQFRIRKRYALRQHKSFYFNAGIGFRIGLNRMMTGHFSSFHQIHYEAAKMMPLVSR